MSSPTRHPSLLDRSTPYSFNEVYGRVRYRFAPCCQAENFKMDTSRMYRRCWVGVPARCSSTTSHIVLATPQLLPPSRCQHPTPPLPLELRVRCHQAELPNTTLRRRDPAQEPPGAPLPSYHRDLSLLFKFPDHHSAPIFSLPSFARREWLVSGPGLDSRSWHRLQMASDPEHKNTPP